VLFAFSIDVRKLDPAQKREEQFQLELFEKMRLISDQEIQLA
jgi:predicted RNase H-like nuclease (RuvC/YqgF family)